MEKKLLKCMYRLLSVCIDLSLENVCFGVENPCLKTVVNCCKSSSFAGDLSTHDSDQ